MWESSGQPSISRCLEARSAEYCGRLPPLLPQPVSRHPAPGYLQSLPHPPCMSCLRRRRIFPRMGAVFPLSETPQPVREFPPRTPQYRPPMLPRTRFPVGGCISCIQDSALLPRLEGLPELPSSFRPGSVHRLPLFLPAFSPEFLQEPPAWTARWESQRTPPFS